MPLPAHRWLASPPRGPAACATSTAHPGRRRGRGGRWPAAASATPTWATTTTASHQRPSRSRSATRSAARQTRGRRRRRRLVGWRVIVPAVLPPRLMRPLPRGSRRSARSQKMPGNDIQGGFASHVIVRRGLCPVDEAAGRRRRPRRWQVSIVADALTTPHRAVRRRRDARQPAIVVGAGGAASASQVPRRGRRRQSPSTSMHASSRGRHRDGGAALTLERPRTRCQGAQDGGGGAFAKSKGLRSPPEWFVFECSGTAAGSSPRGSLLVHGRRCRSSASRWTRSRCGCRTRWRSTRARARQLAARPTRTPGASTSCSIGSVASRPRRAPSAVRHQLRV